MSGESLLTKKEENITCSKEGYYIKKEIEGKMKLDYFKQFGISNEHSIFNRINLNNESIIHTFNLKNESILLKYDLKNGNIIFKKRFKYYFIESNLIENNEYIYLSGKTFKLKENEPKEYFNFFRSFIDQLSGHSFKKIYGIFILKLNLKNGEIIYDKIIGYSRYFENFDSSIHSLKNLNSNELILSGNFYNLLYFNDTKLKYNQKERQDQTNPNSNPNSNPTNPTNPTNSNPMNPTNPMKITISNQIDPLNPMNLLEPSTTQTFSSINSNDKISDIILSPLYSNHLNYCFISKINKKNGNLNFINNIIGICNELLILKEKNEIILNGKFKKRMIELNNDIKLVSSFSFDIYFLKYNLNLNKIKNMKIGGSFYYNDEIISSSLDFKKENLYLLGYFIGNANFDDIKLNRYKNVLPPKRNIFLLKYNLKKNGKIIWGKRIGNENEFKICKFGMKLNEFNSIFILNWRRNSIKKKYQLSILNFNSNNGKLNFEKILKSKYFYQNKISISSESCELKIEKKSNNLISIFRYFESNKGNEKNSTQNHNQNHNQIHNQINSSTIKPRSISILLKFKLKKLQKCVPCEKGKYYSIKLKKCLKCPLNYYSNTKSSLKCLKCPKNTFTNQIGSIKCIKKIDMMNLTIHCPKGTREYKNKLNITICIECIKGYYNSIIGSKICLKCSNGLYSNQIGSTKCLTCPNGKISLNGIHCVSIHSMLPIYLILILIFISFHFYYFNTFNLIKRFLKFSSKVYKINDLTIESLIEENQKLNELIESQSEKIIHLQTKINHLSGNDLNDLSIKQIQDLNKIQLISLQKLWETFEKRSINYCTICLENISDIVLLPCKHQIICNDCSDIVSRTPRCPLCQIEITSIIKIEPQNKS
eukprot:gene11144-3966_t